jgi:hypothetical protein
MSFSVSFTSTITGKDTISEVVDAIPIFFAERNEQDKTGFIRIYPAQVLLN